MKKQQEVDTLRNLTIELTTAIENRTIDVENANRKIDELSRRLGKLKKDLEKAYEELGYYKGKYYNAYMNAVNCYCESYSDRSITIGFDLVDENGHALEPATKTFQVYVYKLASVSDDDGMRPLIYSQTGQSYLEREITLPSDRISATFTTPNDEFRNRSNNYYVQVFNKEFNKPLNKLTEIKSLDLLR